MASNAWAVSSAGVLTLNGNAVAGVLEVDVQLRFRPAVTLENGTVIATPALNVSLEYTYRSQADASAILAQDGGTGVLGTTLSSAAIGVKEPLARGRAKAGDTVSVPATMFTSGNGALIQDGTGDGVVYQVDDALTNQSVV